MWVLTSDGVLVNTFWVETIQVEMRPDGFAVTAQLHEIAGQAKHVLKKATDQELNCPSRLRLTTRADRLSAEEARDKVGSALSAGIPLLAMEKNQFRFGEQEEDGAANEVDGFSLALRSSGHSGR